jgi:hypothetical protein
MARFAPPKRVDKRGITRLHAHREKQNPVRTPRTPCPDTTDIDAEPLSARNGNKRPDTTDITNHADCPDTTDITSLTISQAERARNGEQMGALSEWATPTLVEIEYTPELRRRYRRGLWRDEEAPPQPVLPLSSKPKLAWSAPKLAVVTGADRAELLRILAQTPGPIPGKLKMLTRGDRDELLRILARIPEPIPGKLKAVR